VPNLNVSTSDDYGIDPDAKEAIAFAVLAHEFVMGRPGNLPSATGARRAVLLGRSTPLY
jgi:anhydro-N-acetylmuramic acid kinase